MSKLSGCGLGHTGGTLDKLESIPGFSVAMTVADIELIRETVGLTQGIKASGGVRTLEAALKMIGAGATRIGTSFGITIAGSAKSLPE